MLTPHPKTPRKPADRRCFTPCLMSTNPLAGAKGKAEGGITEHIASTVRAEEGLRLSKPRLEAWDRRALLRDGVSACGFNASSGRTG